MVTPIQEWQPQVEDVTLPSGKVVQLKRPDMVELINGDGDVPDLLSSLILDLTQNNMGKRQEVTVTKDNLPQIMASMNVICKACFVVPQLWDNNTADETHIPIKWVAFNDKAFVMAWALGGQYEAARAFPQESNGHLETVPGGDAVPTKAK